MSDHQQGSTQQATHQLGSDIVAGRRYRPGDLVTIETVVAELGVSRAIAREALQALHHMRLIDLQPRVGATVRPLHAWDVLNPTVIEWRLALGASERMWRSLTELRAAIEPSAARLAAIRAPGEVCRDLLNIAYDLQQLGMQGLPDDTARTRYRDLDASFHRTMLAGSQNEMFASLTDPLHRALNHRIDRHFAGDGMTRPGPVVQFPRMPEPVSLWLHVFLAHAIDQGNSGAAGYFIEGILAETHGDLRADRSLLDGLERSAAQIMICDTDRNHFLATLADALRADPDPGQTRQRRIRHTT